MKKKVTKYQKDFYKNAKKVMGVDNYAKAIKNGQKKVYEIKLKLAREMMGLNQTDLKGLSQPEVSKIEGRKDLKLSTIAKYAKAMGMKVQITLVAVDKEEIEKKEVVIFG